MSLLLFFIFYSTSQIPAPAGSTTHTIEFTKHPVTTLNAVKPISDYTGIKIKSNDKITAFYKRLFADVKFLTSKSINPG